jgi:hypothetical protein
MHQHANSERSREALTSRQLYSLTFCPCLQNDTALDKDTSKAPGSVAGPATVPAQQTVPAKPKPEGWKGLGYWLATTDRKEVEDTLCAIRDDFLKQTKTQTKIDNTEAAPQKGQAAGSWRKVGSISSFLLDCQ